MNSILGLDWSDGHPFLRVRRNGDAASRLVAPVGWVGAFRVLADPRVCVGHVDRSGDEAVYVECARTPLDGGRWCERCRTVEQVLAASLHQSHHLGRGAVDPRVAKRLDQPHRLYLAVFRDGSLKVGTTAGAAGGHRLVEQGAWFARYVGLADDGFIVRRLEDRVTEELGIGQAVSTGRKISGLTSPRPDEDLRGRLGDAIDKVQLHGPPPGVKWLDEPWANPAAAEPVWQRVQRYPHDLLQGVHAMRCVAMCGRVAAIEVGASGDVFAADVGVLFGRVVAEADPADADDVFVQDALF